MKNIGIFVKDEEDEEEEGSGKENEPKPEILGRGKRTAAFYRDLTGITVSDIKSQWI